MRMKRFWRKLKGGDGGKNGDRAPINAALGGASEKCQRQQETREPEQLWSVASGALAVCSDAPQAEATAKSSLTPGNTCIEAAVPGGEPDTCSSLKGFRRSEPPADEPPSTPEVSRNLVDATY